MNRLLMLMMLAMPVAVTMSAEVNPCALLTDAEARKVFPEAGAGRVDRRLAKDGILYCLWSGPGGKGEVLQLRADQSAGDMKEEIEALAMGISDPLKANPQVRFEKFKGLNAIAVVERPDAARGVIGHAAFVGVQKGGQVVILASSPLASRDRAAALKVLEDLARTVLARM